jgi:hypothetical protein
MNKLNCSVGDLAITVNCVCPENLGNIVRVVEYLGLRDWGNTNTPLPSWQVEIESEHGWLLYEFDGYPETYKAGPVPDRYLRRIVPPACLLTEELSAEQSQSVDLI